MPYISKADRMRLAAGEPAATSGELSYKLYLEIVGYVKRKGLRWQTCSDVFGAIEGAKQEFKQDYSIPYEKNKKEENGGIEE